MYTILKPYYPHYKSLTQLGLPIIIGQIGTIILGLADTLMIGQHSTTELGAAAFVNNMFVLDFSIWIGLCIRFNSHCWFALCTRRKQQNWRNA